MRWGFLVIDILCILALTMTEWGAGFRESSPILWMVILVILVFTALTDIVEGARG